MENLNDYQKLEHIRLAVGKALDGNLTELERQQALKLIEELVEDLRENLLTELL